MEKEAAEDQNRAGQSQCGRNEIRRSSIRVLAFFRHLFRCVYWNHYGNYNFYVIIGRPSSTASRASLVVPKIMLTTSAVSFQIADESNYKSFNLSYSGSLVTLAIQGGNGQINRVFGIN